MRKLNLFFLAVSLSVLTSCIYAQERSKMFHATMDTQDALKLKKNHPNDVKIIKSVNEYSAVMLNEHSAEELHHTGLRHGPGYFYETSEKAAIEAIVKANSIQKSKNQSLTKAAVAFEITQDQLVNQSLGLVNNTNIDRQIKELENYGTRYHTKASAKRASTDLKAKWEGLAGNRSDVSVRLVNHSGSQMPSVIMTITGTEKPNEYVVLGGHLDSTSPSNQNNAPGADDNASGIATITEVARVLFSMNYKPKRTVEFMAFAAEEIGLVGSKEIARDYKNRNVNIVSYVQLDMTNYKGSTNDIFITTDSYNSTSLNNFLTRLMDHYNASGTHKITYGTSACNYGCSDHHSFAQQGYETAFPIEAKFRESNPKIHTSGDTSSNFPTANATHAAKFAKLALEYLIEVSNAGGGTPPTGYCASNGQKTSDEYIGKVALGTINKTSTAGSGGYSDFTAETTNLSKGTSHTITVTPTWVGSTYDEGYAVWIDYNQDKDFADSGELVWSKTASKTTPVSGSFTVPASAKNGSTRMRVSMKYNAIPTACESFEYGEVEDYTVVIGGSGGGDTQAPSTPAGLSSSNVAQTTLTLSWTSSTDNVGVTGYDVYKGNTVETSVSGTTASITGLTASTAYTFSVKAKDAAGNVSAASNVINVTTTGGSSDPCAGVAPYNSSTNYQPGDRVTYQGNLYERTNNNGWTHIGPCGGLFARSSAVDLLSDDSLSFDFYPNPVTESHIEITVNNELWKSGSVLVVDVKGNIVREIRLKNKVTQVNTSKFSTGVYFLTLFNGSKSATKQMIIK
ncbi:M20/M25/M40 family metallo-hydrolase [Aquimarina spinulae]|uniref:M20/M25/M40 family metallo-hydrolase n=1 Tax=Aquimarina spinulae TaxID=1192023 RepID=UPI000D555E8E|nr:M20/M25/M40 family metallo-hydrolase [Aquimarina spinulae]